MELFNWKGSKEGPSRNLGGKEKKELEGGDRRQVFLEGKWGST